MILDVPYHWQVTARRTSQGGNPSPEGSSQIERQSGFSQETQGLAGLDKHPGNTVPILNVPLINSHIND